MIKRQKHAVLRQIAMYFAEQGKIMTQEEYVAAENTPVRFAGIRSLFRSYPRLLSQLKQYEPELWAMAEGDLGEPEEERTFEVGTESKLNQAKNAVDKASGATKGATNDDKKVKADKKEPKSDK